MPNVSQSAAKAYQCTWPVENGHVEGTSPFGQRTDWCDWTLFGKCRSLSPESRSSHLQPEIVARGETLKIWINRFSPLVVWDLLYEPTNPQSKTMYLARLDRSLRSTGSLSTNESRGSPTLWTGTGATPTGAQPPGRSRFRAVAALPISRCAKKRVKETCLACLTQVGNPNSHDCGKRCLHDERPAEEPQHLLAST